MGQRCRRPSPAGGGLLRWQHSSAPEGTPTPYTKRHAYNGGEWWLLSIRGGSVPVSIVLYKVPSLGGIDISFKPGLCGGSSSSRQCCVARFPSCKSDQCTGRPPARPVYVACNPLFRHRLTFLRRERLHFTCRAYRPTAVCCIRKGTGKRLGRSDPQWYVRTG